MAAGIEWAPAKGFEAGAQSVADHRMLDPSEKRGLSPRQKQLQARWKRYVGRNYQGRTVDWDGTKAFNPDETEQIATAGYLPNGFVDTSGSTLPLRYRKPSAPYGLYRSIVDRFTGLLFSNGRMPQISAVDNPELTAFVKSLVLTAKFWPAMKRARTRGGAQGTVAMGFQILDGRPLIEVHDARWLQPIFSDRFTLRLKSVEKKFQFPVEFINADDQWETTFYWYRRVIDEQSDTTFVTVPVNEDGTEPVWEVASQFKHDYGFCPVIWIQNFEADEDIDGATDCETCTDAMDELDRINSQANRGTLANGDPTLVLASDGQIGGDENGEGGVKTGSDNAISGPSDLKASYLELNGTSITISAARVTELRRQVLEVAQCVLDADAQGPGGDKTATEVNKNYSSMLSKASTLRETYGEAAENLLGMLLRAIAHLAATGNAGLRLKGWKGPKVNGLATAPEMPPEGVELDLKWPEFFDPTIADVQAAVTAIAAAVAGGLLDKLSGIKFLAPFLKIEDPQAVMDLASREEQQDRAQQSIDALNGQAPPAFGAKKPGAPGGFPPKPPGFPPKKLGLVR